VAERASRKVHYQQQVQDVSNWIDTVKHHREAETLDFRPLNRIHITKDELIGKFEPTTDFEREVAWDLEQAKATQEADILRKEEQWGTRVLL
jgi:U3 small nucleolar RNA-associated protein 14